MSTVKKSFNEEDIEAALADILTEEWFYTLMNRWSKEITTRKTHSLASTRAASCTQEIITLKLSLNNINCLVLIGLVVIFGIAMKLVSVVIKVKQP